MKVQIIAPTTTSSATQRLTAHSHIKSLGLSPLGTALPTSSPHGFIGQHTARESAGILVDLIQSKRHSGRALLLAGPPGTGKTAIAYAISRDLGPRVPFHPMIASEVHSLEVGKTAVLQENFRRAIGVRVREVKEVYEGEVVELSPVETVDPLGGYTKTISHVNVKLKATKGQKHLKLDPTIYDGLVRERVVVGDVIYIEAGSGAVKRVGRSDSHATEFDLEAEEYVPVPKGDVHKKKEVVQDVTLHDLDVANARPTGGKDVVSVVNQMLRSSRTEITEKLRQEVNRAVDKYLADGTAELTPGVLFIDEAHLLDLECFAYLNRALEDPRAPVVVLATNRGWARVRGTDDIYSAHGIPRDFLDRVLITSTQRYTRDEIAEIVRVRARAEGIPMAEAAVERLAEIGEGTSMRYVVGLLGPAKVLAGVAGREEVSAGDVEEVRGLFGDARKWSRDTAGVTQQGVYLA